MLHCSVSRWSRFKGKGEVTSLGGLYDYMLGLERHAPVNACPLDDGDEEGSSELSYLALVNGSLDETECLEETPHRTTYGP